MFGKRLLVSLMVLTFLVACGSNPTRDGGDPQTGQQTPTQGSDPSPHSRSSDTGSSRSGGPNLPSDPRALLAIVGIIVVLVAAQAVVWTVDYVESHSSPDLTGAVKDGVYHAKGDLFSVAVPGDYPAHGGAGVKVREVRDQGHQQVVFLPAVDTEPLYGVSMQQHLSPDDAAMSLDDYASKLYPSPIQDGKPLRPVLDQKLTLDGKSALFREYIQIPSLGAETVYYLLYFIKNGDRSALVSITWTDSCPKCATGPEGDIRAMDPHLKQFVDSFHLAP